MKFETIRVISMDHVRGGINDIWEVDVGYRKNGELNGRTQQAMIHAISQLEKGNHVFLERVNKEVIE